VIREFDLYLENIVINIIENNQKIMEESKMITVQDTREWVRSALRSHAARSEGLYEMLDSGEKNKFLDGFTPNSMEDSSLSITETQTQEEMKKMNEGVFKDGELQRFIKSKLADPWMNTDFEGYVYLHNSAKGKLGENYAERILNQGGFCVGPAPSSTSGYDRSVNEKKCEIKFSLATRNKKNNHTTDKDSFMINHVSKGKDWDFLLFIGINVNPHDIRIIWFNRDDFKGHFKDGKSTCFGTQQGGKNIKNDDYMCTNYTKLVNCEWVHVGLDSLRETMFS